MCRSSAGTHRATRATGDMGAHTFRVSGVSRRVDAHAHRVSTKALYVSMNQFRPSGIP